MAETAAGHFSNGNAERRDERCEYESCRVADPARRVLVDLNAFNGGEINRFPEFTIAIVRSARS